MSNLLSAVQDSLDRLSARVDAYCARADARLDADWQESKHPRARDGRFGSKPGERGGGGTPAAKEQKSSSKPAASGPGSKIKKTKERAFTGKQIATKAKLSKQEAGAVGERIAASFMKSIGYKDSSPVNSEQANFPVDLVQDHELVEVKTGLVSNGPAAQQWRATIGQPGVAETKWLKKASPEQKRIHNAYKKREIMKRKQKVLAEFSKKTGKKFKGKTITLIINPDRKTADVYVFDGFHHRIGWQSEEAKKGYVGSFEYS